MTRIMRSVLVLVVASLMATGCVSTKHPKTLTADTATKVKTVAILDEIYTPTSLVVPGGKGGAGGAIGALLVETLLTARRRHTFETGVRANGDFQKVVEEKLRESFTKAVTNHPGWTLVEPNEMEKADAAFLLAITSMGTVTSTQRVSRGVALTITISATLIGKPPFEIVRIGGRIQAPDSTDHPILYQRIECISSNDNLPPHKYGDYYKPGVFKAAFGEAIDLGVKRIADSWTTGQPP